MPKIFVIGASGSGKSTFSRNAAEKFNIPYMGVDDLYWQPGWEKTPTKEYLEKVRSFIKQDHWIIEGVAHEATDEIMQNADLGRSSIKESIYTIGKKNMEKGF